MAELRIERHHNPREGYHLGSGKLICLDGDKEVASVRYSYWNTAGEFYSALTEPGQTVEGPFFRRYRRGHWIADIDIDVAGPYRKTRAFALLIQAIDDMDMPIYARFGNERLAKIFRRRYKGVSEPSMRNLATGTEVVARRKGSSEEDLIDFGSDATLCGETLDVNWEIYRWPEGDEMDDICGACLEISMKRS